MATRVKVFGPVVTSPVDDRMPVSSIQIAMIYDTTKGERPLCSTQQLQIRKLMWSELNRNVCVVWQGAARSLIAFFARLNKMSPAECYSSSFLAAIRFDHYNSVWHLTTLAAMVIRLHSYGTRSILQGFAHPPKLSPGFGVQSPPFSVIAIMRRC